MTRRAFWIGGWAALVAGTLTALATATVVVIGILALAGSVTYPVDADLGPFSVHDEVSMPVDFRADVCQSASVREPAASSDCLKFFVHDANWSGGEDASRVQDADVRPTSAMLTGTVELATTGGWSGFVAASVARKAIDLTVTSAVLLLWRLLASSAAGAVFSARSVTYVRAIGWLLIAGGVAQTVLGLFTATQLGYEFEAFGGGPSLTPGGNGSIELGPLALGGLILLLAEVFRHGAAVEAEQKLTV